MKLRIVLIGLVIAIGSATLWAQDSTLKPQASAEGGPTAVTPRQSQPQLTSDSATAASENGNALESITVPAGTKIPLMLKQGITTKNAHVGDPVYAQTSFPVTMNDHIAIPSGTLVQGEILRVDRKSVV